MEGETINIDLEWNDTFDNLVQSFFRKKFYDLLKKQLLDNALIRFWQQLMALPIFPLHILKPITYLDDAVPGPQGCRTPDQINIFQVESE